MTFLSVTELYVLCNAMLANRQNGLLAAKGKGSYRYKQSTSMLVRNNGIIL